MKAFPDTNVWLSAMVFSGLCAELLIVLCESDHQLLASERVHAEICDILARKFARHTHALENLPLLWQQADVIKVVPTPADDADARLTAAAAHAGADLFITGDKRVLGWRTHAAMRIVNPRQAWALLHAS